MLFNTRPCIVQGVVQLKRRSETNEEEHLLEKGLRYFEDGRFDDAAYFLGLASLIFFAKGDLERAKEAGELALKAAEKAKSHAPRAQFFSRVADRMLKEQLLPETIEKEFYEVVSGIDKGSRNYKYVVMAGRRIIEYMKSKGQKVSEGFESVIEEGEFLLRQREKFDPEKDKVFLAKMNLKLGFMNGFYQGKLDFSKVKEMLSSPSVRLGEIKYEGARITIVNDEAGGAFMVFGVRDEEHAKRILEFIKNIVV